MEKMLGRNLTKYMLSSYKQCSLSSVDVELAFSLLKYLLYILDHTRYNLSENHLEMYTVVNFNENYLFFLLLNVCSI